MKKNTDEEEILALISENKIKLHEIEKHADLESSVRIRREYVEKKTGARLEKIGEYSIDEGKVIGRNIENMIGVVQTPIGIVGPLEIRGEYADGEYFIPLSTTEGALVASINRGCLAITSSGGAVTRIFGDAMSRSVIFGARNIIEAKKITSWLEKAENLDAMRLATAETTSHGELLEVQPFVSGRNVYARFLFDTKDAMGMNMATIACENIAELVTRELGIEPAILSGNMCSDKKPAAINNILGRGKTVAAEAIITREVAKNVLKTTPGKMFDVNYGKNLIGSARAGSMGFNAHVANPTAAIYLACGQDLAHVIEAVSGTITSMEILPEGDLYSTVTMPAIQVGTVGGGTGIETQRECLEILGVAGSGNPPGTNAKKFAEIVAAVALAGEISLIAALAEGKLAEAHKKLGRRK